MAGALNKKCFEMGYGLCDASNRYWRVKGGAFAPPLPLVTNRTCPSSCFWNNFFWNTLDVYPLHIFGGGCINACNLEVGHEVFVDFVCIDNDSGEDWNGCIVKTYTLPDSSTYTANDSGAILIPDGSSYGLFTYMGIHPDEITQNGTLTSHICVCGTGGDGSWLCSRSTLVCHFDTSRLTERPGAKIWIDNENVKYTDVMVNSGAGVECGYCHCIKNDGCNYTDWSEQCAGISLWDFQNHLTDQIGSNDLNSCNNGYCDDGVDNCSIILTSCLNYARVNDVSLDDMWSGGATISTWFCKTGGGGGMLVSKGEWEFRANGGVIRFLHRTDGICAGIWNSAEDSFTCGVWNNVVITYNSDSNDNSPCIYVNGVNKSFSTCQQPSGTLCDDSGAIMYLGNAGTGGCDCHLGGKLSQTWLFSEIIDNDGITNLYNNCKPKVEGEGHIWVDTAIFDKKLHYIDCKGSYRKTHEGTIFTYNTWAGYEDFLGCNRGAGSCGHIWVDTIYNYGLVAITGNAIQFKLSNGAQFNNCEHCEVS